MCIMYVSILYPGDSDSAELLLVRIMDWRAINARGSNSNKLPGVLFATGIDVLRINAEYGLIHMGLGRWGAAIDTLRDALPGIIIHLIHPLTFIIPRRILLIF